MDKNPVLRRNERNGNYKKISDSSAPKRYVNNIGGKTAFAWIGSPKGLICSNARGSN